jgi:hypothetical protein
MPRAGKVCTWLGQASMLGEDGIHQPSLEPNGAASLPRAPGVVPRQPQGNCHPRPFGGPGAAHRGRRSRYRSTSTRTLV